MYRTFFNLDLPPFEPEPDSRFIVLTPTHREALATLVYALDQREGWALLYGGAGLGKTTLLKALMMELDQATRAGVVAHPSPEVLALCNQIALVLGLAGPYPSKGSFFLGLRQLMGRFREQEDQVLLIVDDAQALSNEQLLELRLMATADQGEPRVFNIFLSARPLIKHLLQQTGEQDLGQLLHRQQQVRPLGREETALYLAQRLRAAGGDPAIFPPETVELIHAATQGVPRLINLVGLGCLQKAAQQGRRQVSPRLANQALQDLGPLAKHLEHQPTPPLLPRLHHHLYQGVGTRWSPCADPPPRPALSEREEELEERLAAACHPSYRDLAWWDKTTQFTVEWDGLRRRRLGLLGPAFPSFCPRWVDGRWEAFNLARREADSLGAGYTDWIDAQYRRLMGDRLGELPLEELHGQAARAAYGPGRGQTGGGEAQPVKPPFELEDFDPDQPEHARHAAQALEEIFDLAAYVCAQEKRGAADFLAEAVCQAVLPLKALNHLPQLQQQVSDSLRRMERPERPAPDPPSSSGRPPIII